MEHGALPRWWCGRRLPGLLRACSVPGTVGPRDGECHPRLCPCDGRFLEAEKCNGQILRSITTSKDAQGGTSEGVITLLSPSACFSFQVLEIKPRPSPRLSKRYATGLCESTEAYSVA